MHKDAETLEQIIRDNTDAGVTLALEAGNPAGEAQARIGARRAARALERLLGRWSEGAESVTLERTRGALLIAAASKARAGTEAGIILVNVVTTVLAEALGEGEITPLTTDEHAGGALASALIAASGEALEDRRYAQELRQALETGTERAQLEGGDFAEAARRLGTMVQASAQYVRSHGTGGG